MIQTSTTKSKSFLDYVHGRLSGQFNTTWWRLTGYSLYLNPPALIPGVYNLATAKSIEGFSPIMMILLDIIQASVMLFAVETKNKVMFYSMLFSVMLSTAMLGIWALRDVAGLW